MVKKREEHHRSSNDADHAPKHCGLWGPLTKFLDEVLHSILQALVFQFLGLYHSKSRNPQKGELLLLLVHV